MSVTTVVITGLLPNTQPTTATATTGIDGLTAGFSGVQASTTVRGTPAPTSISTMTVAASRPANNTFPTQVNPPNSNSVPFFNNPTPSPIKHNTAALVGGVLCAVVVVLVVAGLFFYRRYNASKKGLTDTEMDPADNLNESALHQVKPFKVEYHTTDLHKTQTAPWNKQQFNPPPQQPSKEQQQDIMDEKGITGPLIFARSPHAVIDYSNHYSAHASSSSSSTSPPTRQPPWLPPRTVVRPLDLSVPDSNDIELSDNSSSKKSASAGRSAERSPEADDSGSYPRESMISALDYINRRASSLDYINPKASPTTQPQQRVRRNPQCLVYTPSSETDSQPYVAPPTTTSAAVTSIVQPSQRQKQRDSQKQQGEEPVDVILASYGHRTNRRNRRGPRPSAYPSSHSTLLSSSNTATNPASTSTSKSPYVPPASYSSSSSSTLASPSFALLSPPYYPPPVSSYSSPPPPSVSASSSSSSSSATALLPSTKFQSPTTIPRTPSKALSRGRRHVSKRNGMYVQDDEELQMRLERQIAEIKAEHERQYELQQQTLERLRVEHQHQLEMLMQRLTTKKI